MLDCTIGDISVIMFVSLYALESRTLVTSCSTISVNY